MPMSTINLPKPSSAYEFDRVYSSREACLAAVIKQCWPEGFQCPECGHDSFWMLKHRPVIQCSHCQKQFNPLAGTMFTNTKLPLQKLFKLCYLVVSSKAGISGLELARQSGVSEPTAELWKRKLRFVMANRDKEALAGIVEVDECIIGGKDEETRGRGLGVNKALVVISVEDDDGHCGRVRLRVAKSGSHKDLREVVMPNIKKGSKLRTDGWPSYKGMPDVEHEAVPVRDPKTAHKKLPLVHRVASLLKRHILGTLQGSWHHEWLPWMLEEWEFKFNRRRAKRRPMLFESLLRIGINMLSPTRKMWHEYTLKVHEINLHVDC